MSLLLDTNVVSEAMKPQPNPGVAAWMNTADEDRVYLSVVSLTELRYELAHGPPKGSAGILRGEMAGVNRHQNPKLALDSANQVQGFNVFFNTALKSDWFRVTRVSR